MKISKITLKMIAKDIKEGCDGGWISNKGEKRVYWKLTTKADNS